MTKKNKVTFGLLTMLTIATISIFAIHSIHKTHQNILGSNSDIDWDI